MVSCQSSSGWITFDPGLKYAAVRAAAEKKGTVWKDDPFHTTYQDSGNPTIAEQAKATAQRTGSIIPDTPIQVDTLTVNGKLVADPKTVKTVPATVGNAKFTGVKKNAQGEELLVYEEPAQGTVPKKAVLISNSGQLYEQNSEGNILPMSAEDAAKRKALVAGIGVNSPEAQAELRSTLGSPSAASGGGVVQGSVTEITGTPQEPMQLKGMTITPTMTVKFGKTDVELTPTGADNEGYTTYTDSKSGTTQYRVKDGQAQWLKKGKWTPMTGPNGKALVQADKSRTQPELIPVNTIGDSEPLTPGPPLELPTDTATYVPSGMETVKSGNVVYKRTADNTYRQDLANGAYAIVTIDPNTGVTTEERFNSKDQRTSTGKLSGPVAEKLKANEGTIQTARLEKAQAAATATGEVAPQQILANPVAATGTPQTPAVTEEQRAIAAKAQEEAHPSSFTAKTEGDKTVYKLDREVPYEKGKYVSYTAEVGQTDVVMNILQPGETEPSQVVLSKGSATADALLSMQSYQAQAKNVPKVPDPQEVTLIANPTLSGEQKNAGYTAVVTVGNTNLLVKSGQAYTAEGNLVGTVKTVTIGGKSTNTLTSTAILNKDNSVTYVSEADGVMTLTTKKKDNSQEILTIRNNAVESVKKISVENGMTQTETMTSSRPGDVTIEYTDPKNKDRLVSQITQRTDVYADSSGEFRDVKSQHVFEYTYDSLGHTTTSAKGKTTTTYYDSSGVKTGSEDAEISNYYDNRDNLLTKTKTNYFDASGKAAGSSEVTSGLVLVAGDGTGYVPSSGVRIPINTNPGAGITVKVTGGDITHIKNTNAKGEVEEYDIVARTEEVSTQMMRDKTTKGNVVTSTREVTEIVMYDPVSGNPKLENGKPVVVSRTTGDTYAVPVYGSDGKKTGTKALTFETTIDPRDPSKESTVIRNEQRQVVSSYTSETKYDTSSMDVDISGSGANRKIEVSGIKTVTTTTMVEDGKTTKATITTDDKGRTKILVTDEQGKPISMIEVDEQGKATETEGFLLDMALTYGSWDALLKPEEVGTLTRTITRWAGYDEDNPYWPEGVAFFEMAFGYMNWAAWMCRGYLTTVAGTSWVSPSGYTSVDIEGEKKFIDPCEGLAANERTYRNGTPVNCTAVWQYKITGEAIPGEVGMEFDVYLLGVNDDGGDGFPTYSSNSDMHLYKGEKIKLERGGESWRLSGPTIFIYGSKREYYAACIQFTDKSFNNLKIIIPALGDVFHHDNPYCNKIATDTEKAGLHYNLGGYQSATAQESGSAGGGDAGGSGESSETHIPSASPQEP